MWYCKKNRIWALTDTNGSVYITEGLHALHYITDADAMSRRSLQAFVVPESWLGGWTALARLAALAGCTGSFSSLAAQDGMLVFEDSEDST